MARYIDGFVVPVPTNKVADYRRLARKASKIWMEHGALEYIECVADDMNVQMGVSFPKLAKLKPSETVVFAWVVYRSRAHRDRVNAKVMSDPRLSGMDSKTMPFDCQRMSYGGFKTLVEAFAK